MSNAFLGRQAIYDYSLSVYGYELIHHCVSSDEAGDPREEDAALSALIRLSAEGLSGGSPCFIDLNERFLGGESELPMVPERVILQAGEGVRPTKEVLDGIRELKEKGAELALAGDPGRAGIEPFLELADYLKIDTGGMEPTELEAAADGLRSHGVPLLAEKVETKEELRACQSAGFELFQGQFLTRPEIAPGFKVPGNKVSQLKLMNSLLDPEVEMDELSELISHDASLTYKLLRCANSATYAPGQPISSISQMIMMIGLRTVRKIVSAIVLMELNDQPGDLLAQSLVRAKMCEQLAAATGEDDPASFYTVGLLSTLDALTGASMEDVLEHLPLSPEIRSALLEGEGDRGFALTCVRGFESGDWGGVCYGELGASELSMAYIDGVHYSREIWGSVPTDERPAA